MNCSEELFSRLEFWPPPTIMVNMNQTSSSTWLPGVFAFIFSVNILLSVTATLGNALILVALHKDSSLHPPTKLLFRCLALTDLCVGLISQPLFGTFIFRVSSSEIVVAVRDDKLIGISSYIPCGVSVLTTTAISVDRLLALLMGLRYRQVVTVRRVCAVIVSFWLIAVSCGLIHLWSYPVSKFLSIVAAVLSVITSIFSYTKIYFTLRQHQAQVHVNQGLQPNAAGIPPLNIARYKKTVSSIAWVQLALLACYVPFFIGSILLEVFQNMIIYVVFLFTATLVYLNSSLNPFLYCWKIREVREAVKETIRQFKCSCN